MQYDQNPNTQKEPESHGAARLIGALIGGVGFAIVVGVGVMVLNERMQPEPSELPPVAQDDQSLPIVPDEVAEATDELEPPPELSPAEQLREAQHQVETLQTELTARNAELASLEEQLAKRDAVDAAARDRARARQAAVEHEIESLKFELAEARTERDALRADLKEALAEVDRQVKQNDRLRTTAVAFKEASSENLWYAFTNNAKVRICDRGTYKRRQSCEEDLDTWFDDKQHAAFTSCVNTQQAVPMLWKAEDDTIPAQAQRIDARDRERGDDWFVIYCDPSLPETVATRDITEEAAPVFAMSDF